MKKSSFSCVVFSIILIVGFESAAAQFPIQVPKIPKIKKEKTVQTQQDTQSRTDAGTPDDVQTNPNAPTDYNANLNVGEQAIAVDRFKDIKMVKIIAKSGASYKVGELKSPDSVQWYSANSVYPYFDVNKFSEIMYDYKSYVSPYLPCFGKKHNLDEHQVTVEGYNAFGARHFDSGKDTEQTLQAEQPKLAELDGKLKSIFGGAAPNTFLEYLSNPAIVAEIASQRTEYLKCAVGVEDDKPDFRLPVFLSDIKKAQGEAERYTPQDFLYLVSAGDASDELLRAVSKRAREEWVRQWLKNPTSRADFDTEWDKLAAIAAKKIPTYKPSAASFQFRYPVGEKLLMNYFKNPSTLKIFRIGSDSAGWEIEKGNNEVLPSYRYRTVRVYLRDSNDDHPYCRVVSARIKQDYAGGGRYNSEVYRSSVSEEIYGCP